MGSLLAFIPVVGQMVVYGWLARVHRALLEGRDQIPPLAFADLGPNLNIGIAPWLVHFIVGLVGSFVIMPVYFVGSAVAAIAIPASAEAGASEATTIAVAVVFSALAVLLVLGLVYVVAAVMTVALIRAELVVDVSQAFAGLAPRELWRVARLVKGELVLCTVGSAVGSVIVVALGLLALYFGIFPAMIVVLAANAHFRHQLYSLYLARGGTPLPLAPLPGVPPAEAAGQSAPLPYAGPPGQGA